MGSDGADYLSKWTKTSAKPFHSTFELTKGKYFLDSEDSYGLTPKKDEGKKQYFFGLTSKFDSVDTTGKNLVLQFTLKQDRTVKCAGSNVYLFDGTLDQDKFDDEIKEGRYLRFGPEICENFQGARPARLTFEFTVDKETF